MKKTILLLSLVGMFFSSISPAIAATPTIPRTGIQYSHTAFNNNDCKGTAIVRTYQNPGVRDQVKQELASLKSQGVQTIRLFIWYAHGAVGDPANIQRGVLESTGGKIDASARANLTEYFNDIRDSGIPNLIVVNGSLANNDPSSAGFTPALLEENWSMLQDIHDLAKTNGPAGGVTFDLANEIGPRENIKSIPNGTARFNNVVNYIATIWKRYVAKYGSTDASFGTIVVSSSDNSTDRALGNLVTTLQATGVAMPQWYPMSLYVDSADDAYLRLRYVDQVLKSLNSGASIRITESYYDDEPTAQGVKKFALEGRRPVLDFLLWPLRHGVDLSTVQCDMSVGAPFTMTQYAKYFVTSGTISCNPSQVPIDAIAKAGSTTVSVTSKNVDLLGYASPATQVCVNTNTSPMQLMTAWSGSGVTSVQKTTAPWILDGQKYTFTLLGTVAGSTTCQGIKLASCDVSGGTTASVAGDLNGDGKVDIFDYNALVTNFGHPYTIFDYNTLVANFGK